MKFLKCTLIIGLSAMLLLTGCSSMNRATKGAAIGTAAGGAMGAVIGRAAGNTAMGTVIGAAVGGTTGAIIGNKMDKQAEEIKNTVPDAKVERVGEGIVVEFSSNILFGFDQSSLSNDAKVNLDKLVTVLNHYPDTDIEIQGHTDSRDLNHIIRLFRKNALLSEFLSLQKGIAGTRMKIKGFGETLPYDKTRKKDSEQKS